MKMSRRIALAVAVLAVAAALTLTPPFVWRLGLASTIGFPPVIILDGVVVGHTGTINVIAGFFEAAFTDFTVGSAIRAFVFTLVAIGVAISFRVCSTNTRGDVLERALEYTIPMVGATMLYDIVVNMDGSVMEPTFWTFVSRVVYGLLVLAAGFTIPLLYRQPARALVRS